MRSTLSILAALMVSASPATAGAIELRDRDVAVFVGGTDLVRLQEDGRLEAALTARFRDRRPRFRDLAWDGDTVFFQGTVGERWRREAFGGWREQLDRLGATVVVAQFGKIESLDGAEALGGFLDAYGRLLDELGAGGRRLVLVEPLPFSEDWLGRVDDRALPAYAAAVEALAAERGIPWLSRDGLAGLQAEARGGLVAAVREKHRLWVDYWRPANWKCLFGDDSRRVFSNAAEGLPSFRDEWSTFPVLIAAAEEALLDGGMPRPVPPPPRTGSPEADAAAELAAFEVLDGFEVTLFADESHGVANPLSIRWDARGRMFVACSDIYPQVEPGVRPDDRIILLRDDDRDGSADHSGVFADGLNIPTGMEVGHDHVLVGQGTQLLILRDTDDDGRADRRDVLLSGFGNGDSHQTINSFTWSPGGELWFCQGDGIESRVETPSGIASLFQAGVFRLRPGELRLDGLLDDLMGPGNPWGIAFDDFGQSFVVDGAGGISFLTPGSIPANRRRALPRIGDPGGYCGVECLGAGNLPDDLQGEFLVGDYKKNQVSRFAAVEDGAGFSVEWREPLLRSSHRNFRPVDVKTGPDGAIYVVDWYNPITCHQDDFYRHPDRDKTHGRIWRVAPIAGTAAPPAIHGGSTTDLVDRLASSERWTRLKVKQVLATRPPAEVAPVVRAWSESRGGRDLVEAVALLAWLDAPDAGLAGRLLRSPDHRARAYAARVIGRWGSRLDGALDLLEALAGDAHPRVRMEAVLAAAHVPEPDSILVVATAAEKPRDRWIDYALAQAIHHLTPRWLPAFRRGELDFGDRRRGLAAVLEEAGSDELIGEVRELLRSGGLGAGGRRSLAVALVTASAEPDDIRLVLGMDSLRHPDVLRALAARERPDFDVAPFLRRLLGDAAGETVVATIELARAWRVEALMADLLGIVERVEPEPPAMIREAAVRTLGALGGREILGTLERVAESGDVPSVIAAIAAMLEVDVEAAARSASRQLAVIEDPGFLRGVFLEFAGRERGARSLAAALGELPVDPGQGTRLREAWIATGLADEEFARLLDRLAGIVPVVGFEFSAMLVDEFVAAAGRGHADRGEALFRSARAGCLACHAVGSEGRGGRIGPDLGAVGAGVPPERIVTEVLWPRRQVKEGFVASLVTLHDGRVLQGVLADARDRGIVRLRDLASGETKDLPRDDVARIVEIGSLMPPTAQSLTHTELGDLFAFLFSLRGRPE